MDSQSWQIRSSSNDKTRSLINWGCLMMGGLCLVAGRYGNQLDRRHWAALAVGVLLLLIGFAAIVLKAETTVTVDTRQGQLRREVVSRFGTKTKSFAFSDITGIEIKIIGNRVKSGFQTYLISFRINDGHLESTGWLSIDEYATRETAARLEASIGLRPNSRTAMGR